MSEQRSEQPDEQVEDSTPEAPEEDARVPSVAPMDSVEPDTEVHYIAGHGAMLHAVPMAVDHEIQSTENPDEVTCEVCKGLLVRPVHYVRESGRPLHPAHDADGATHKQTEVTCTACQNLISAGLLDEPENEEQDEESTES